MLGRRLSGAGKHQLFERRHFLGAERQRPIEAHFDAGPAVVVVAGSHHRHAFDLQRELSEVGHWRHGEPDVVHLGAAGQQARHERLLHGTGVGAIVVADHKPLRPSALVRERGKAKADGIQTHQVDLGREQPACVILAKARRLDQGQALKIGRIEGQVGARLGQHLQGLSTLQQGPGPQTTTAACWRRV
jgi:hypothetical protein